MALTTAGLWLTQRAFTHAANSAPRLVGWRVPPEVSLSHLRPRFEASYGSFRWVIVAATDPAPASAQVFPDPFSLRLGEQTFDIHQPPNPPTAWAMPTGDQPDLYLVQFMGPTQTGWLAALEAVGLRVVQYIHPFTYVVWGTASQVERVQARDFVYGAAPFAPALRVPPAAQSYTAPGPRPMRILIYRGANNAAVLAQLARFQAADVASAILNDTWRIALVDLTTEELSQAARIPGVYAIQPTPEDGGARGEMSSQVNASHVDEANRAFPGYAAWLQQLDLSGHNVIIANVDSGLDQTHPDLTARIRPCSGLTCGGDALSGHGTHTAGIMAGDGSAGVLDSYGFGRGLGTAPGAGLVEQKYDPFYYTLPDGMLRLMNESYANGARVSGNSWGPSGTPRGYDSDTLQVDIGVRDADPQTPGNQPLNYVLSIMNGYGGVSTQGTPDEAKNIFSVGATVMQAGSGAQLLNIDDIGHTSAHGPALDERFLPMLVAPGCYVDSTFITHGYTLMCGTSMASPQVSGSVALFIEYYRQRFGVEPSPALVKAAFLPVAHDLAGHLDADGNVLGHPVDSRQGWGRLNVAAVIDPVQPILYFDNPTVFDNTGEEWQGVVYPADASVSLRLMLAWSDAPGHGLGGSTPAWNNDLDLMARRADTDYVGNAFGTDGWSRAAGSADYRNNTEGIFLSPGAQGVTVIVRASNLTSDGVPGYGDTSDQDFALVCVNCRLTPPPPTPGLSLIKRVWPDSARPGQTVTYQITRTLTPYVPITVTETVTDMLPVGLSILTPTITLNGAPAPYLYDGGSGFLHYSWSPAPVAAASVVTIAYQAVVTSAAEVGMLQNDFICHVDVAGGGPVAANGSASLNILPPATVQLTKTVSTPAAYVGETVAYALERRLSSVGAHTYAETLLDVLPTEVAVITPTILINGTPAPWVYDDAAHALRVTGAGQPFLDEDVLRLTYVVRVMAQPTAPLTITNSAETLLLIDDQTTPFSHSAMAALTIFPHLPYQIQIGKWVTPDNLMPGGIVTFTLTRTISLPGAHLYAETLTDTLPAGLTPLPESIRLNGLPAPELYEVATHSLRLTHNLNFQAGHNLILTYQARLEPGQAFHVPLTNRFDLLPALDGVTAPIPLHAAASVTPRPTAQHFLPVVRRR